MIRYFIYFVFFNIFFVFNCNADELRITSDNNEVDRKNKISIFGNVSIIQTLKYGQRC